MNREEALNEFVKSLRTAFNNALAYQKDHPYFIKSAEEFKLSIDLLLNFMNPIEIDVSPKALSINGFIQDKLASSAELARMLHSRRVEKISIKPGFNINELSALLSALALPAKDIIKEGGMGAILQRASVVNISVENLDYSSLLASQEYPESGNRWRNFLSSLSTIKDTGKINEFADSFLKSLKDLSPKEVLKDKGLREDLASFLLRIKEIDRARFSACLTGLFNYLSGASSGLSLSDLNALKELFGRLDEDDFAHILWSNLTRDNPPDSLFFNFFSVISEGARQDKIAGLVASSAKAKNDPHVINKIKSLLLNPVADNLSFVYRNTLSSMLKEISTSEDFYFDPAELKVHYYFVLLNMLVKENNHQREKFIIEKISREVPSIFNNGDYQYIGYLMDVIEDKKREPGVIDELYNLEAQISGLIEESAWREDNDSGLSGLLGRIKKSCNESSFYLNKIFDEGKVNGFALRLFFRFFPGELGSFYARLQAKRDNLEFLSRVIKASCGLDAGLSLLILEHIYSFSGEIIKVEVIKAMRKISKADETFLIAALKGSSRIIKKEVLLTLSNNKEALNVGLNELFNLPNFFGRNNRVILENMSVIEELRLKEGELLLKNFTRMRFFWHTPLRKMAQKILEIIK